MVRGLHVWGESRDVWRGCGCVRGAGMCWCWEKLYRHWDCSRAEEVGGGHLSLKWGKGVGWWGRAIRDSRELQGLAGSTETSVLALACSGGAAGR